MGVDVLRSVRSITMKLKREIWSLVILIEVNETYTMVTFKVTEGQGQGHEAFEVAKMTIFKFYLLRHFSSDLEFDCGI